MARTQTFSNSETGLIVRSKLNSIADWTGSYTYGEGDITHYFGSLLTSLVDNNIGHAPSRGLSSSYWRNMTFIPGVYASASVAGTASMAFTASYVANLYPQTVQVSASWASASLSASYALVAAIVTVPIISGLLTTGSLNVGTQPVIDQWGIATDSGSGIQIGAGFRVYFDGDGIFNNGLYVSESIHALSGVTGSLQGSASYALYAEVAPTIGLTGTRSFASGASGSATVNVNNEVHILNGLIIDWLTESF